MNKNHILYKLMFLRFESRHFYEYFNKWKDLKQRLLSHKLAATNFGVILGPHSIRETMRMFRCIWKKITPNLLFLVAETWGTDVTTSIERVEPSSFAAAGDGLSIHPNRSRSTFLWWSQNDSERCHFEEKSKLEQLGFFTLRHENHHQRRLQRNSIY